MTPEQSALAVDHMWLARTIARDVGRCTPPMIDPDDLEGIAMWALCVAATRYREGPVYFKEFAKYRIRGAISDFLRRSYIVSGLGYGKKGHIRVLSLDVLGTRAEPDPAFDINHLTALQVMSWIKQLPKHEALVLVMSLAGETGETIGRLFNRSPSWVSWVKKTAIRSLQARAQ